uniref:EF-hand domain-containing protein n=1 Tax=Plectus sambesii TaxID=2011161 RepID=A0A914XPL2_9BILA
MTQFFSQKDIDQYRECFYLYAQKGLVESSSHLRYIMRSLGYSPTVQESQVYFKSKNGKIDFACFLDVLHEHQRKGDPIKEVLMAFRSHDRQRKGVIPAKELRAILTGMGERMAPQEIDRVFREANVIDPKGLVRYEDFVRVISIPLPDY